MRIDSNLKGDLKIVFDNAQARAIEHYWRSFIILSGKNPEKPLPGIIENAIRYQKELRVKPQVLYVSEDREQNIRRYQYFIENTNLKGAKLDRIYFKETQKVLGKTYDILIMDLTNSLTPDDLGRLFGLVRGTGLIIALAPSIDKWDKIITTFHEHLVTPPYTIKDVKHYFEERWVKKLFEHEVYIYDTDKEKAIKYIENEKDVAPPKAEFHRVYGEVFPKKLYGMCVTKDQAEALKKFENLVNKEIAYVLTADRGRGKSVAVGLGIAGITYVFYKKPFYIGITAPNRGNIESLWEFLKKALEKLELKYEEKKNKIKAGKVIIEYKQPQDLVKRKYDLVAVDEAAGVYVTYLYKIMNKYDRLVFSTTIHGYEGAGRTFNVRFLKALKENPNLMVIEHKMKEPIRYAIDDPVERFMYDVLLLDAEPAKIENPTNPKLVKPDKRDFILNQEEKLRQFVGIYIMAHYKNRPNDIAMLADAPHHDLYYLEVEDNKDEDQ